MSPVIDRQQHREEGTPSGCGGSRAKKIMKKNKLLGSRQTCLVWGGACGIIRHVKREAMSVLVRELNGLPPARREAARVSCCFGNWRF